MVIASVVVASLLAALITYSAALKLTHRPKVVEDYHRAGVPEGWLNWLAALLLAAAAGLVVGHWWAPAGIAAAGGLVAYFALAVAFHIRKEGCGQRRDAHRADALRRRGGRTTPGGAVICVVS
jgi:DoxX-like family